MIQPLALFIEGIGKRWTCLCGLVLNVGSSLGLWVVMKGVESYWENRVYVMWALFFVYGKGHYFTKCNNNRYTETEDNH